MPTRRLLTDRLSPRLAAVLAGLAMAQAARAQAAADQPTPIPAVSWAEVAALLPTELAALCTQPGATQPGFTAADLAARWGRTPRPALRLPGSAQAVAQFQRKFGQQEEYIGESAKEKLAFAEQLRSASNQSTDVALRARLLLGALGHTLAADTPNDAASRDRREALANASAQELAATCGPDSVAGLLGQAAARLTQAKTWKERSDLADLSAKQANEATQAASKAVKDAIAAETQAQKKWTNAAPVLKAGLLKEWKQAQRDIETAKAAEEKAKVDEKKAVEEATKASKSAATFAESAARSLMSLAEWQVSHGFAEHASAALAQARALAKSPPLSSVRLAREVDAAAAAQQAALAKRASGQP